MMDSTKSDILEQILQSIKLVDLKVDSLGSRLHSLENRFDSLDSRLSSLENRFDSLDSKVETLQENYSKLAEHIEKVTDHNISILAENQLELNRKLNILLEQSDSLSFSMYRTHVTVLTHRVDNLEKDMEILKGIHA